MVLTQRERYIAIGAVGALALLLGNYFLLSPYFSSLDDVDKKLQKANQQLADTQDLFTRQRRLRPLWTQMQTAGLNLDASLAESQAQHAVLTWADSAGVTLTSIKPERQTQEGAFEVIGFEVAATGATPSISRLLWSMESAAIPIHLNEVQVGTRKEGSDDLTVRLSISVLCLPPAQDPNNKASSDASDPAAIARSGS